jgi:hypothetical protein
MQETNKSTETVSITLSVGQATWLAGHLATFANKAETAEHQRYWANDIWGQIAVEEGRIYRAQQAAWEAKRAAANNR